jgi:hypothetical protein
MLTWRRMASVAAVWAALAGLTGIAQAHPGHDHGHRDHARHSPAAQHHASPAIDLDFSEVRFDRASPADGRDIRAPGRAWIEAAPVRPAGDEADACQDRGCCAPGSCYVGIGLVAPSLPVTFPPSLSGSIAARDGPPCAGLDAPSLRRPPKTFA